MSIFVVNMAEEELIYQPLIRQIRATEFNVTCPLFAQQLHVRCVFNRHDIVYACYENDAHV